MTKVITTRNLTKTFQGKEIISNLNLHVNKGEIYGFLGPNGAGKTTVMKMLMNFVKPSAGEIELFGQRLTSQSYEMLKRIGSMIEFPIFYEKLSARENLELHCEYMGYYKPSAIEEALEMVKLQLTGSKAVKDFSLGMKQRLGIARAICTKPELLILDEPINGLDPVGIKEIRQLFQTLCNEYGVTILISSHILSEIEQIADTVGVIRNGMLVAEVALDDIRSQQTEYIELLTYDARKALYVLDNELGLKNVKLMDQSLIRIYDHHLTQNQLSKTLISNDVNIEAIARKNHSLEDYFMNLIEGDENSAEVDSTRI
ncbi:ABC transporter ATP-binding protein [Halalkalibacterium halodurans]|uniref:Bacitracin ABC transporter (ATP-binding protein) n=1 Tax=Halalkalibacterium halodurans (strain ATCC BAA-125 / DSM 18197 / FERM 7344 / JCM 9153 / C-125) TaxID=272558 RepID=Q9KEN4_HALH5|nr:ABC transporter ATP-binding protein [Halalkalibacterium halodurans]MED4122702.1 ABC transporter ATP-binding protein [Halalkalibacterium halodurans]MED4171495.1 ABC transporter ATP-binding protein [Halalkalibacterium halodurans]BAB04537.1 bacitracin ABC transporter (ATP-binding protein) [Halalkalibacterium halodurans C-125]